MHTHCVFRQHNQIMQHILIYLTRIAESQWLRAVFPKQHIIKFLIYHD